ncbi:MAG: maltose alpha-D-glucosyltransferase [Deltaproteobacteria bacterium]|nr:maltose alpha-D-glucosyltransferase [Deltaproteobacteria bacterium]
MAAGGPVVGGDPLWYKDAIIYELHVKAFFDSDGNGIGDFGGLTAKLDYLADLGVTALWLLPFYPSPLKDDGYDIADYLNVHPSYGTLAEFKRFLREAHRRGLRVITELVLNHTSSLHPWFERARRARPGSALRNFYVWSDTPERYRDARIIFQDFEASNWTWDPVAKSYYWHRFYSHQPDLNFENPQVQKAMFRIMEHWFGMGVDGVRLDAVPYLYEREGTNCENLPETHEFLRKLRAHVDRNFPEKMFLAEANQWPEDSRAYFGHGDECHMAFHFPVMPRLFMALRMEDRFPIVDILNQTPAIPENCQWALFLRNHDELTLEMVTDEERDYMYRVYGRDPRARINLGIRRRLAPLMNNDRRRVELMKILLFSLPGTPVLYYGDEIGMGDNFYLGDRDGVRTPMQWSPDRNAGFSLANPHSLYLPVIIEPEYHSEAVNVENQDANPSSFLWWVRRMIAMRRRFQALSRGTLEFVRVGNPKVLAFVRQYGEESILVVANLSRFCQVAELDLSQWAGFVPEEVFSRNLFPRIGGAPYVLTLGVHEYFWLRLVRVREEAALEPGWELPEIESPGGWQGLFQGKPLRALLDTALPSYIAHRRWFRSKARTIQHLELAENLPVRGLAAAMLLLRVAYTEGLDETYCLPLARATGTEAEDLRRSVPQAVVAGLRSGGEHDCLYDAVYSPAFRSWLLETMAGRKKIKGREGELTGVATRELASLGAAQRSALVSRLAGAEQTNTSILYEPSLFLKLYRGLEEGLNPDTELVRFLTERTDFQAVPRYVGSLEYRPAGSEPIAVAMLQNLVPNQGDAWTYTLDSVGRYFEQVLSSKLAPPEVPAPLISVLRSEGLRIPPDVVDLISGQYLEMTELLGRRTGQMHLALASDASDPHFRPEPWSTLYQRSVFQAMQAQVRRVFELLARSIDGLEPAVQERARAVLASESRIIERLGRITGRKIATVKIRIHGDYHLGQVLYTGRDFVIIDFEGEPARALSERRLKRSPFRDVAGMIRSFHYAVHTAQMRHPSLRPEDIERLEPWVKIWYRYVSGTFLTSYLAEVKGALFVPSTEDLERLIEAFLLNKAVYELGYELNNRPAWVGIPLRGILRVLEWGR